MKTCSKCQIAKSEDEFQFRVKGKKDLQSWCRSCMNAYRKNNFTVEKQESAYRRNKARRARNMKMVWDYLLAHPCPCGESDPTVLEFDHRDQQTKIASVSSLAGTTYGLETIINEMEKCDVLCANCHRRKTALQCGWYKNMHEDHAEPLMVDRRKKLSDDDIKTIITSTATTTELLKTFNVHRNYINKLRRNETKRGK